MNSIKQRATSTLSIQGMTCGSCEQRVRRALEALPGVESAQASRSAGQATINYNPSTVTPVAMTEALRDAGYPASVVATAEGTHAATTDSAVTKPSCGCCQV